MTNPAQQRQYVQMLGGRWNKLAAGRVWLPMTHTGENTTMQRISPATTTTACILTAVFASALALAQTSHEGDPVHGKALYQSCAACHSIDENDLGPKHRGVVGRRAGSIEDYTYSSALKNSGLTWDKTTLDRWLTNPSVLVPGTKMYFKIDDPQGRADIIAYLEQLR
jgi:cytochrome c